MSTFILSPTESKVYVFLGNILKLLSDLLSEINFYLFQVEQEVLKVEK